MFPVVIQINQSYANRHLCAMYIFSCHRFKAHLLVKDRFSFRTMTCTSHYCVNCHGGEDGPSWSGATPPAGTCFNSSASTSSFNMLIFNHSYRSLMISSVFKW